MENKASLQAKLDLKLGLSLAKNSGHFVLQPC
jgi:hypothetical protein